MLRHEQQELLTQTGPATPLGELLRRYWVPALLSEELPAPDCPPVRVKLLSLASSMNSAPTGGYRSILAEMKKAACAARIMAGNTITWAIVWKSPRSRKTATLKRKSNSKPTRAWNRAG